MSGDAAVMLHHRDRSCGRENSASYTVVTSPWMTTRRLWRWTPCAPFCDFCYRTLDRLYSSDVTVTSRCRTDDAISRVGTSVVQLLTDYTMSVTVGSRSPTWPPRPQTTSPRWLSSGDLRGFRDVIRHTLQLIAYRISWRGAAVHFN